MSAFADCTGLRRVDIPAGVTEVGIAAFIEGSPNLEVHFQGSAPASLGGTGSYTLDPSWGPSFDSDAVLYYRTGTSGWTDSSYYDAGAQTWMGYALRAEPAFSDVSANAYYAEAVDWAVEQEITNGTGGGNFSPSVTCDQSQILTFLWRAAGSPDPAGTVTGSEFYAKAVQWGKEYGIIDDSFSPATPCTRETTVTYMWRYAGSPTGAPAASFKDISSEAVSWAVNQGVTNGTGDGSTFSPNMTCDRGQIVTFLFRAFGQR